MIGSDTVSTDESSPADGDTTEESPSDEAQDFTVESGFTSGTDSIGTRYNSAGALLTNPNPDLAAYGAQVLFNLVGPGGDVLDTATETVSYIGPGETVPVAPLQIGFDLKNKPTKLEVQGTELAYLSHLGVGERLRALWWDPRHARSEASQSPTTRGFSAESDLPQRPLRCPDVTTSDPARGAGPAAA